MYHAPPARGGRFPCCSLLLPRTTPLKCRSAARASEPRTAMSRPGSARLPGFGSSNVAALTDGEMSPEAYSPTQKYALDLKRTMLKKELNQIEGILEKTGGCTRRGCRRLQSTRLTHTARSSYQPASQPTSAPPSCQPSHHTLVPSPPRRLAAQAESPARHRGSPLHRLAVTLAARPAGGAASSAGLYALCSCGGGAARSK